MKIRVSILFSGVGNDSWRCKQVLVRSSLSLVFVAAAPPRLPPSGGGACVAPSLATHVGCEFSDDVVKKLATLTVRASIWMFGMINEGY